MDKLRRRAADRSGKLVIKLGFRTGPAVFNRVVSGGIVPTASLRDRKTYKALTGRI